MSKLKNKGARTGKEILPFSQDFTEFLGLAPVSHRRVSSSQAAEFPAPAGKTRSPSPPAPQQALPVDNSTPPLLYHLPPQSCGQTLHPSSGALCRGSNQYRVDQDAPSSERPGAGTLCGARNPVRRRRSVPPRSRQHPLLLPQRGFPLLSLSLSLF